MKKKVVVMTYSGLAVDVLDPNPKDFAILDIAHGLSNACRYSGQCREFYSVAQHSVILSRLMERSKFALLHDAAEAYIGDLLSPIKQIMRRFRSIERVVQSAIFESLNCTKPNARGLVRFRELHHRVTVAEVNMLFEDFEVRGDSAASNKPLCLSGELINPWSPHQARKAFLDEFVAVSGTIDVTMESALRKQTKEKGKENA